MRGGRNYQFLIWVLILDWVQFVSTNLPVPISHPLQFKPGTKTSTRNICQSLADNGDEDEFQDYCSRHLEENCKPLPPMEQTTEMPFSEMLSTGIIKMKKERANTNNSKAIFILGNTGSGKTTVAHIVLGDLSRLHATRTKHNQIVVIDDDNRIGPPTTKSKTLVPLYLTHNVSKVAFWDCPGFDDNRGPKVDIAAMYFVKYALDTTNSAKFLFTASHSSVKAGANRNDFDLLVTHGVQLLKNVTRLRESIGLIVTKVGSYGQDGSYLSDQQILNQIREFLRTYNNTKTEELHEMGVEGAKKRVLKSKIEFVQGILGHNSETGEARLFFSRSPTRCGPFSEMRTILTSRKNITKMYSKGLAYAAVTPHDFLFTLKPETLRSVENEFIPEAKEKMGDVFKQIVQDLENEFREKFYGYFDNNATEVNLGVLNGTCAAVQNYLDFLDGSLLENDDMVGTQFSDDLEKLYKNLNFSVNSTLTVLLRELERQVKFYVNVTNGAVKAKIPEPEWLALANLKIFSSHLSNLKIFYEFCESAKLELRKKEARLVKLSKTDDKLRSSLENGTLLELLWTNKLMTVSPKMFSLWHVVSEEEKHYLKRLVQQRLTQVKYEDISPVNNTRQFLEGKSLTQLISEGELQLNKTFRDSQFPKNASVFLLGNNDLVLSQAGQRLTTDLADWKAAYTKNGDLFIKSYEKHQTMNKLQLSLLTLSRDEIRNITFWNWPAFDEKHSPKMDIATVHLLQRILDSTSLAKFILVISQTSLMSIGNDHSSFDLLVHQATHLLNGSNRMVMMDSIGLIVTDVDSYTEKYPEYKTDKEIIEQIKLHLESYISSQKTKLGQAVKIEEKAFIQKKINFVHGLVLGSTPKFSFLRKPSHSGNLAEMPEVVSSKNNSVQLHMNTLKFASVIPEDLLVEVKDQTYLQIETIYKPEAEEKIKSLSEEIANEIEKYLLAKISGEWTAPSMQFLSKMNTALKSFLGDSTDKVFSQKITQLNTFNLIKNNKRVREMKEVEKQLQLFVRVSGGKVKVKTTDSSWTQPFANLDSVVTEKINSILQHFIPDMVKMIYNSTLLIQKEMQSKFEEKFYTRLNVDKDGGLGFLQTGGDLVTSFLEAGGVTKNAANITKNFEALSQSLDLIDLDMTVLTELEKRFNVAKRVTGYQSNHTELWNAPLRSFSVHIDNLLRFFAFCGAVENELVKYAKQMMLNDQHENGQMVSLGGDSISSFLERTGLYSFSEREKEVTGTIADKEKEYLANLVKDLTPKLRIKCIKYKQDGEGKHKLVISGKNLLLSSAFNKSGWPDKCKNAANFNQVNLIAMERVYLDTNVMLVGKTMDVSIIASKWTVETSVLINLDGIQPADLPQAPTGYLYGYRGIDGMDGLPGGDAGSFFGIYASIESGDKLQITADGGRGGKGQDGGRGSDGEPGSNASWKFPCVGCSKQMQLGRLEDDGTLKTTNTSLNRQWYTMKGYAGGIGGDGGKGGNGGAPGASGTVELINVTPNDEVGITLAFLTKAGDNGEGGNGGLGGLGGYYGNSVSCLLDKGNNTASSWKDCYSIVNTTRGVSGGSGVNGREATAKFIKLRSYFEPWQAILDYKTGFSDQTSRMRENFVEALETSNVLHDLLNGISEAYTAEIKRLMMKFPTAPKSRIEVKCIKRIKRELLDSKLNMGKGQDFVAQNMSLSMENLFADIELTLKFYKFCEKLENTLLGYIKQMRLKRLSRESGKNLAAVKADTILNFLESNDLIFLSNQDIALWKVLNLEQKEYLSNLTKELVPTSEMSCVSYQENGTEQFNRLTVSGRNVLLSSVFNKLEWPEECKHDSLKQVSVVAMEHFYFDVNVHEEGKLLDISIVAPNWHIVAGSQLFRKINLNGVAANDFYQQAPYGLDYGGRGADGQVGRPGGKAGSFFGIYSKIENGAKLHITGDGGSGGKGQKGGNGVKGKPGDSATRSKFPCPTCTFPANVSQGYFVNGLWKNSSDRYTMFGEAGGRGGDGGNGGTGGPPGIPGTIQLIQLLETKGYNYFMASRPGAAGAGGDGGSGRRGGRYGRSYTCAIRTSSQGVARWADCDFYMNLTIADSGADGQSGKDGELLTYSPSSYFQPWKAIQEYKRKFLGHPSNRQNTFLNELRTNKEIQKLMIGKSGADKGIGDSDEMRAEKNTLDLDDDSDDGECLKEEIVF